MSTTPPSPVGWTPPRTRRARMFALLLAACAVATVWAVFQPWFAWATPGLAPSCEPAPSGSTSISVQMSNRDVVNHVAARGCITGLETVAAYDSPVGTAAGVSAAQQALPTSFAHRAPSALLGMPRAAAMLLVCLALAWFGVSSRKGWIVGIALFMSQIPHKDLAQLRGRFMGDAMSTLTISLEGLQIFTWSLLLGSALMLAAMLFVLKVNFEQRAHDRKAAREAGEEDPAEPLDPLMNWLGRKVGKVRNVATEASARTATHATQG